MLQPRECFSGIELSTRNVRPGGDCTIIQQLQAVASQEAFPRTRRTIKTEIPLFTSELQGQLDDVRFSFTEDFDGWQEVWGNSGFLVEADYD